MSASKQCDRCKKHFGIHTYSYHPIELPHARDTGMWNENLRGNVSLVSVDLCGTCLESLRDWFKQGSVCGDIATAQADAKLLATALQEHRAVLVDWLMDEEGDCEEMGSSILPSIADSIGETLRETGVKYIPLIHVEQDQ